MSKWKTDLQKPCLHVYVGRLCTEKENLAPPLRAIGKQFIQASSHCLLIRILHTNQRIHQTVLGETLPIALKHQKNIGSISSKLHMTVS